LIRNSLLSLVNQSQVVHLRKEGEKEIHRSCVCGMDRDTTGG
jgi:hypothetical protein